MNMNMNINNQPNNPNKRTKISDKSEVELHRTNDNEIITKESKDAKTIPKRTKISDKSKLDELNAIVTADDIGQNPSTSKTIKAKSKNPNQSDAGLSSKATSSRRTSKSKSNQNLNENDFLSDLCGDSVTGNTNVTVGGHCTNENTEGEDGG